MLFSNTFSNSLKNLAKIIICFCLVYTPFFANAGAAEKWEIVENVYNTSKNVVNVTAKKVTQQASNSGVYKVQVPVSASALGKTVKTMMWTGIAVAGVQAMLEGIGWIIDTGSKTIKRPKSSTGTDPVDPSSQYYWTNICYGGDKLCQPGSKFNTAPPALNSSLESWKRFYYDDAVIESCFYTGFTSYTCILKTPGGSKYDISISRSENPDYNPNYPAPTPEYEYLSDTDLGNEIIGKGENKVPLPDAIADAYSPNNPVGESEPAPKATNDALNNANPQPEKEPEGKSETEKEKDENGEETGKETTKFEWPNACEWFPAACDFFTVQKQDNKEIKENQKEDIAQNKTFFQKVSDWFDWTRDPPEKDNDNNEVEIEDIPKPSKTVNVSIGDNTCPSMPVNIHTPFNTISTDISPVYLCQIATGMKTFFIALGFFTASLIVGRRN